MMTKKSCIYNKRRVVSMRSGFQVIYLHLRDIFKKYKIWSDPDRELEGEELFPK